MDQTDWGVPDWHDNKFYLSLAEISKEQVRWEFLRRNPDYRQAWLDEGSPGQARVFTDKAEYFGLETLQHPKQAGPPRFLMEDPVMPPWNDESGEMAEPVVQFVEEAARHGFLLIAIDPSLSLQANQDRIASTYRQYEAEFAGWVRLSRIHMSSVGDYIRILDAHLAGLTFREIAEYFSSRGAAEVSVEALTKRHQRAKEAAERHTGVPWTKDAEDA